VPAAVHLAVDTGTDANVVASVSLICLINFAAGIQA
jgi:hypothetical protein